MKPKFGRLKTKFDDDAEGGPRSGPADPNNNNYKTETQNNNHNKIIK